MSDVEKIPQVFIEISLEEMHARVAEHIEDGWRFLQLCATTIESGIELVYTLGRGPEVENLVTNIANGDIVPSITDLAPAAFFFENETKELFGVNFKGIAIDFGGNFYKLSEPFPMNPDGFYVEIPADEPEPQVESEDELEPKPEAEPEAESADGGEADE
ncbi:MAG: NADH-quinone oxidoreductase subunit C [bacterium]|nr:NADH-quinone oxidoreductase subunit C [bacterium]